MSHTRKHVNGLARDRALSTVHADETATFQKLTSIMVTRYLITKSHQ